MFIAALALAQAVAGFSPQPFVWPAPSSMSQGSETASVSPSLPFFKMSSGSAPKTLQGAFDRYEKLSFPHATGKKGSRGSTAGAISSLSVSVSDVDESHPTIDTDESYTLKIAADEASLSAATVYGAMRGLETFSQLVQFNFDTEEYYVPRAPISVQDSPRFPHRGLMIDSARHFETLDSIRAIIDSLVYAKLNVLHWHMVDSQSFPFQSKTQPKLWDGAYSEYEKYTQDDIALIVEYARERGVRVIVEFDMPGHAASWCTGYPEICPSSTCQQPLNVANNFTFKLIDDLLGECTGGRASSKGSPSGLFPDNFIHLGGDEVDTSCWTKTPAVAKWLADRNMTGDDGYAFFVKNTAAIAIAQGRRPVQWSEVYDHFKTKLDKNVIVHVWKDVTNVTEVVANGYDVIRNVGYDNISWYLDNLNVNWTAVYQNEPCNGVPDDLCPKILGGHGEMWGETVDESDLEQTVWPRLAAIAERLWSPRAVVGNVTDALPRIEYFRCLLNRRGVHAAPVNNADARSSPPGPGGCLTQ